MKNLSKRTKILLGVAAVVLIAVVAFILIADPMGLGLFGTGVL